MVFERNRCVIKSMSPKKIISHDELMNRIRKSFYYGGDASYEDMEVSRPLAQYASELFSEPHKGHSLNRLNIVTAGNIHSSPCTLIMALIYLDRLNASDPNYVRRITPSELFIVSMMVSTKFYCGLDEEIYLNEWAEQGNISEKKLKELELEFLYAIDWNIYVSNNQFFDKLICIEKILAQREGIRRGWLTYTELLHFLPSFTIAKFFLHNIAVMAVSYAASVMTIAGAFFIVSHIPGNALIIRQTVNNNNLEINTANSNATTAKNTNANNTTELMRGLNSNDNDSDINDELRNNLCRPAIDIEEELKILEKEYQNDNNNKRINENLTRHISIIRIHNYKDTLNKRNDKIDENCRNTIKSQNKSIPWYLFISEGNSLKSRLTRDLTFNWFKFM